MQTSCPVVKRGKKRKVDEAEQEKDEEAEQFAKEWQSISKKEQVHEANIELLEGLDEVQRCVFEHAVIKRKSLWTTGKAGTGKSFVFRLVYNGLVQRGVRVGGAAPTGFAAANVNVGTLQHMFHYSQGLDRVKSFADMRHRFKTKPQWRALLLSYDAVMLDEVSMISGCTMDTLDLMFRAAHQKERLPFGGVQVICFGDFCQLPPISKPEFAPRPTPVLSASALSQNDFAFKAAVWPKLFPAGSPNCVELTKCYRQSEDQEGKFLALLNRVRLGAAALAPDDICQLQTKCNETLLRIQGEASLKPNQNESTRMRLYSTRAKVQRYNQAMFEKLPGHSVLYAATERVQAWTEKQLQTIEQKWNAFASAKNWSAERSRAFVQSYNDMSLSLDEARRRLREQARLDPLHPYEAKSMSSEIIGQTTLKNGARVMLTHNINVSERLVNGRCGWVVDATPQPIDVNEDAELDADCEPPKKKQRRVKVRGDADANTDVLPSAKWDKEVNKGPLILLDGDDLPRRFGMITSKQRWSGGTLVVRHLPIQLAWAITIHKAQGLTLKEVDVDLTGMNSPGQAYVALSRASSWAGLGILAIAPDCIRADPAVQQFHRRTFSKLSDSQIIPPGFLPPRNLAALLNSSVPTTFSSQSSSITKQALSAFHTSYPSFAPVNNLNASLTPVPCPAPAPAPSPAPAPASPAPASPAPLETKTSEHEESSIVPRVSPHKLSEAIDTILPLAKAKEQAARLLDSLRQQIKQRK